MDPLEAAIFMLPPIIPPMLLGSHITIVWAMVLLTQFGGIIGHSAFLLPIISTNRYTTWIPFINSQFHDLHHLRFNVNYGAGKSVKVKKICFVFGDTIKIFQLLSCILSYIFLFFSMKQFFSFFYIQFIQYGQLLT